ncbi:MAG: phage tail tube protein [Caulobacterales bacterium]|uniref:phage tail tube protein n=1 Tax=Glycocaulis sp. TaxID=1969725 RepID=UPI003F9FE8CE
MTAPALGRQAVLHMLAQAAAGTAATGNYQPAWYNPPLSPGYAKPFQADNRIGPGAHNPLDPIAPAPGLVSLSPRINVPLCLNHIGLWLPHLFKAAAPAEDDGVYTHVFTSDALEHEGVSLAWQDVDGWRLMNTLTLSSISIPMGQEQGYRAVDFSGMAADIAKPVSSPVGTALTPLALALMPASLCGIRRNGVAVGQIQSGTFRYSRTLVEDRPARLAVGTAERFIPDANPEITVDATVRVTSGAFYDDINSPQPYEFEWRINDDLTLIAACPALRVAPFERDIDGVGTRVQTISMRGEQTSSAPAVTLTLKNGIAAYPVEA